MTRATVFAALLVAWGNVAGALLSTSAWLPGGSWSFVVAGLALGVVSVAFAKWMALGASDIGLRGDHLRGGLLGATFGTVAALVAVAMLRGVVPLLTGRPIDYSPLTTVTGIGLAQHVAFFLPLGDVVPEEVAFRGVLLGALRRAYRPLAALVASGAVFALWHVVVVYQTLDLTTVGWPSPWFVPSLVGALLAVLAGGVVFAWLRSYTRSLATTVAAHWLFNAVLLWGLWGTRPIAPSGCC